MNGPIKVSRLSQCAQWADLRRGPCQWALRGAAPCAQQPGGS